MKTEISFFLCSESDCYNSNSGSYNPL